MIELWKDLFGNNLNVYVWIFVLSMWLMVSNLEVNRKNLKMKISLMYILLYLLVLFNILDIKVALIIVVLVTFISLEFLFIDDFARKIIKKKIHYIFDYIYKVIFEFKLLYFVLSLFILSNLLKSLLKQVYVLVVLYNIICNIVGFNFYSIFTIILSSSILLSGIIKSVNNQFKTLNFTEINEKILSVKAFSSFKADVKLKHFAQLLIYKEDKSYFERNNTYNWISIEFLKYRIKRLNSDVGTIKICNISIINRIIQKFIFLYKIFISLFKMFYKVMVFIYNLFIKVIIKRRSIKSILRGYSTIEMQLIRTIAVQDGYSSNIYQRKAYEFIYSWVYFDSLKNYYLYHKYANINEYKYYLIYLYIMLAPVRINDIPYSCILKMYNKNDLDEIELEEFYIWILGLSNVKINDNIINSFLVGSHNMDKQKLKNLIKLFQYSEN